MIKDFYNCGYVIKNNLTPTLANNGISLLHNSILPIVNKLLSSNAATDTTMLMDTTTANNINAFVLNVKGISSDSTFKLIMDEIILNVNDVKTKQVKEIYSDLDL